MIGGFGVDFYPRSPCGERRTRTVPIPPGPYFYPRSPCGERHGFQGRQQLIGDISIHALLAESDAEAINPS
mgnify:CR=1 FL=1